MESRGREAEASDTENATTSGVAGRARDALGRVRGKSGDLQATLADKLDDGAEAIRERAGGTESSSRARPRRVMGAATAVAGGMERSALWLRENDVTELRALVRQQLRDRPGRTALIALGIGFLLGRALRVER